MKELEVKFLNIDIAETERKLREIGAERVREFFYRRRVFDHPDLRLDKDHSWLRLRDEGDKIMLAFKRWNEKTKEMTEIEVPVEDFEKTAKILESVGLIEKHYVENRRIRWMKDDIQFDIDIWPELDPYLEIEAPSWEHIDKAIALMELDPEEKYFDSAQKIYRMKGIEVNDLARLTFEGLVPRERP